jgi:hypothetical protein
MEVDDTETSLRSQAPTGCTIRFEIGPMVAEPNKIAVQVEGFAKTVEGAAHNNLYHVHHRTA